jgi:uncharacterized protein YprB with RNaseH-like and TPR domain
MQDEIKLEKILFLDIETAPVTYQYKDLSKQTKALWDKKWLYNESESTEERYKKAGIYAEFAKVVCISMGNFHNGKFYVKSFASEDEKHLLELVIEHLNKFYSSDDSNLCAHNGKEFDFPFLCRRMLINKMKLPKILNISGKKPWEVKLLDTMEMWKFGDYKSYTSLDLLAHIFHIPSPKGEIDGSDVARVFWEDKDLELLKTYCGKDVITLASIYCLITGKEAILDEQLIFATL